MKEKKRKNVIPKNPTASSPQIPPGRISQAEDSFKVLKKNLKKQKGGEKKAHQEEEHGHVLRGIGQDLSDVGWGQKREDLVH